MTGTAVTVRAVLSEYGAPFRGHANVRAELIRPDGSAADLALPAVDALQAAELHRRS